MKTNLKVAIDASRCRSGGAKAHLIGIITGANPELFGIKEVHIWSYQELLNNIPNRPWLVKHSVPALNKGIISQIFWQGFWLMSETKNNNCDILFTADASTFCSHKPSVVLSQDLLSYEKNVLKKIKIGKRKLRLWIILLLQNFTFRRAEGVIFLTRYAASMIQKSCGELQNYVCIPHGADLKYFESKNNISWTTSLQSQKKGISILYVSPISEFKNQWFVVDAVGMLRLRGYNVSLNLVGGGNKSSISRLNQQIQITDPNQKFIIVHGHVTPDKISKFMAEADVFVFASSCETFGITLLEAMAAGLPIACSNKSSLPETLLDAGIYFDPEDPSSIANAIEIIIEDHDLRNYITRKAKLLAQEYSWERCARETFSFIADTAYKFYKNNLS